MVRIALRTVTASVLLGLWPLAAQASFHLEEATIADIHRAILAHELTATQLVGFYLKRIEAYNGQCVKGAVDPATGFVLGDIEPIEKAGKLGALMTLNVRGERSRTDTVDNDPRMPDAVETAHALDEEFARTGRLAGPLHGIVFAVKDQFDTFDMRSTSGSGAAYANDRPPRDAEIVARLRAAGAIILAKSNMGEYASGDRSTFGGTTCNPYDTSRSSGRSSGGSGSAVAANLVACAIGEETGPSARNPAANSNLVGIVATHSLVSRAGIIPASLTRDRPGLLCRTVKDAATVLAAVAGYDPRDPATAASVGQVPSRPYLDNAGASLRGVRVGVVREYMKVHTKADEESVAIIEAALKDLHKAGATLVDPGPEGDLFADAIAAILPSLDAPTLDAVFGNAFPPDANLIEASLAIDGKASKLPPHLTLRVIADHEPPTSGETLFAMERYLRERGDKNIRSVADLIAKSTFYTHAPIYGVTEPPKGRLEGLLARTERLTKKSDGSVLVRSLDNTRLDISGWHAARTVLQMLINKVMGDNRLDTLVYPTKTVPAPQLAAPLEPAELKVAHDKVTVTVNGEAYERAADRVLDVRWALSPRLSPNSGLPTIAVPAGFVSEVYDRAVVRGSDGSKSPGNLLPPKAVALPVSMDFMGRAFSEPLLIRIAAAYEAATKHRRPPKDFGPVAGEP